MATGLSTFGIWKHVSGGEGSVEVSGERLRDLQRVLREILGDVLRVARERGLDVTLSGGTCLGAVRHRGFIPWDDDLDLNVTRRDLPALLDAVREEFPGKYLVQEVRASEGYELGLARLRLVGTTVRGRDDLDAPEGECGAYVDLFILESVPDSPVLRAFHGLVSLALGFAYSCERFREREGSYLAMAGDSPEARRVFSRKARLGRLFSFRTAAAWCRAWDRWNSLCRDEGSRYVSIPAGRGHYFGELYRREDMLPPSLGEFEGLEAPLPACPEAYLGALYGPDWMTPPPEEDRERHVVLEFDLGERAPGREDG